MSGNTNLAEAISVLKSAESGAGAGRGLAQLGQPDAKTLAFQAQMRMAIADRALGRTDIAVDLLTTSIRQAEEVEVRCRAMYELAQTYSMSWNSAKAKTILVELLNTEKAPEDVKIMSTYLLADVYEAEHNLPKARELLLSLRDSYPNPEVIATRLASLGKHNEGPAVAQPQPGDATLEGVMKNAGSSKVPRRRVSAK